MFDLREETPRAALVAVFVGAAATLLGLATILSHADHLHALSDVHRGDRVASHTVAYVDGSLRVVAEAMSCLLFTIFSAICLAAIRNPVVVTLALVAAPAKALWLLISVGSQWSSSWKYIVDHAGPHPYGGVFVLSSVAQAVVMFWAAGAALRFHSKAV